MAFFGVTVETIGYIRPHPNADKLELGYLDGMKFQFIVGKGEWKRGDKCLYFPIDSILPNNIIEKLGLVGKLAGSQRNRVKTIKLRDEISMGIIGPISLVQELPNWETATSEEITQYLRIVKYEPPILDGGGYHKGRMVSLPTGLGVYDIEGAERYPGVVERLLDQYVYITEKLEGSNFSCGYSILDNEFYVNTRRHSLKEDPGQKSPYWEIARRDRLLDLAKRLAQEFAKVGLCPKMVTIYGEFVGPAVAGNIYRLTEHKVYVFDIKVDELYLSSEQFWKVVRENPNILAVPLLEGGTRSFRDWLGGQSIQEASNGKSVLADTLREGIVIKPQIEQLDLELRGRLVIKQRSPEYLAKQK